MRLSDERLDEIALNVLERKRNEIITGEVGRIVLTAETAAALIAEVRALRPCEKALRMAYDADALAEWFTDVDEDGVDVAAALAGVRALEDKP